MISSFEQAENEIRSYLNTQWVPLHPGIPISYPNVAFVPVQGQSWIRLVVLYTTTSQADLADVKKWRTLGIASVNIFTPISIGTKLPNQLTDDIFDMFVGINLNGIQFRAPTPTVIGPNEGMYQVNVRTEFYFDLHR